MNSINNNWLQARDMGLHAAETEEICETKWRESRKSRAHLHRFSSSSSSFSSLWAQQKRRFERSAARDRFRIMYHVLYSLLLLLTKFSPAVAAGTLGTEHRSSYIFCTRRANKPPCLSFFKIFSIKCRSLEINLSTISTAKKIVIRWRDLWNLHVIFYTVFKS